MLDPRSLAERRDEVVESCRRRGYDVDVDAAIDGVERVAVLRTALNEANRRRNEHGKAGKKKMEAEERAAFSEQGREIKQEIATIESELRDVQTKLDAVLREIPNFVHPDVPDGGEDDAKELRRSGDPPDLGFLARDHLQIAAHLDLVDFESGARVAGQKWYYLKNDAVLLEMAMQRFAVDVVRQRGYRIYTTPDVARPEMVEGLGFNPRGDQTDIYSIAGEDLCLVGTAEIPLGGLHADQVLDEADLPLRVAGLSHCFRTEAGSHGRESKGLYRVHQFSKVEMFVFCRPEESEAMLDELVEIEEQVFHSLEIPYRVVDIASGDLGAPAHRKFDLEAWMPGRGEGGSWGEITSASNCTDYQARRLRVRFKRQGTGKNELVHTLNGTAVSCARAIVAFLETHQQSDGSVRIPEALRPYMGCDAIVPR